MPVGSTIRVHLEGLHVVIPGMIEHTAPGVDPMSREVVIEAKLHVPAARRGQIKPGLSGYVVAASEQRSDGVSTRLIGSASQARDELSIVVADATYRRSSAMLSPPTIFREEALEYHVRGNPYAGRSAAHFPALEPHWTYWLLVAVFAAGSTSSFSDASMNTPRELPSSGMKGALL